jgi:protein kinase A
LIGLVNTYQDENFVYLLLQLVQGGELYSYIHTPTRDRLDETSARFYAACIAEGLGYMHQQGYCYRDLKPENVLVDATGYWYVVLLLYIYVCSSLVFLFFL